MMGAFYTVQTSGNSVSNQMKKTISVRSDRNIFGRPLKVVHGAWGKGGGEVLQLLGVYVIVN